MSILLNSTTSKIFHPRGELVVQLADPRRWMDRIEDLFIAIKKESDSRRQRQHNPLRVNAKKIFPGLQKDSQTYDEDKQPWLKESSSKLVVLIHGLNSSPLAWTGYLDKISNSESAISYFAPYVYKKGYCRVADAAIPILNVVQTYANQHPNNSIFLVGHSNGARIAAYIEQELNVKNVRLVSIAGPHCGSKFQTWIGIMKIAKIFGITPVMTKELTYLGPWSRAMLTKWQDQQKANNEVGKIVKRVFYATADDYRVFPNKTSFPSLPNSSYYLISRESHVTIVDGVKDKVLSYILDDPS